MEYAYNTNLLCGTETSLNSWYVFLRFRKKLYFKGEDLLTPHPTP